MAQHQENPLETEARYVRGTGERRAELLARLELHTVRDLLFNLPRDVLDLTHVKRPRDLTGDQIESVRGHVVDRDARVVSRGRTLTAILLDCGDGEYVRGTWFNQPWIRKRYEPNELLLFSGKPKKRDGRWEFGNPDVKVLVEGESADGGIQPRYGLTEGLSQSQMSAICRAAVQDFVEFVPDPLPVAFRERIGLPSLREAIRGLHLPESSEHFEQSRRRVLLDDLLEFQLGIAMRRRSWRADDRAPALPVSAKIDARIRRLFPFELTAGQNAAIAELSRDLASGRAMHRLLQADVGAGKTVVAIYGMLAAIAHGYQAIVMAPTEVLANQHWATIDRLLSHSRVRRRQLTGRLTAAQRRDLLGKIREGVVDLVVGTQALIQEGVEFAKLGLVVIDEQHKFGVAQRGHFSVANGAARSVKPHVLVMTATPIPRTLCLTVFGDLDVTAIRELPPGRQRVVTSRVQGAAARSKAWDFVRKRIHEGRQVYVIAPRVEEKPEDSLEDVAGSVEAIHEQLRAGELRDFSVGLVHGRMDGAAKSRVMAEFEDGQLDVLVSTTVVEVGVDVPNATVMVIHQAERFGLSQLHQLRGRIARGRYQGYCFLFTEQEAGDAVNRLAVMERTADGFEIAEADYELRGPGDVLGLRQSGQTSLRVADLKRDDRLVIEARDLANALVNSGEFDSPEFAALKQDVLRRFDMATELGPGG